MENKRIGEAKKEKLTYSSQISFETLTNYAFFKIFSDYFNILKSNPDVAKEHDISDLTFFRQKCFLSNIELPGYMGETNIRFKYKGFVINFSFDKYRQNSEYYYTIIMTSEEALEVRGEIIFKEIMNFAISVSNLKGEYIEMARDEFAWEIKDLEKRDFNDIFLPPKLFDDLTLYTEVFKRKNRLMRYLMVGNPGTGKTESTLVLSNVLKDSGVTIIKTPIDNLLKEKVELAEVLSPSILIFDDLDLAIGSRSKGGYSPKELQTFLDVMDGTDKISKSVGIIATTNSAQLLDLAAQRPGRFEKILSFDILSKKNIGDIILKSLKYNSENSSKNKNLFFNPKIVNLFYDKGVTGSYVFNSINMLELKSELSNSKIDINWIIEELEYELKNSDQLKGKDHLKLELKRENKNLGFKSSAEYSDDNDEEPEYCLSDSPSIRRDSTEKL